MGDFVWVIRSAHIISRISYIYMYYTYDTLIFVMSISSKTLYPIPRYFRALIRSSKCSRRPCSYICLDLRVKTCSSMKTLLSELTVFLSGVGGGSLGKFPFV